MNADTEETTGRYYFIDYDSVGQEGTDGIENLSGKDKVTIFYKGEKNMMELSFVEKLHLSRAEIRFRKISGSDSFEYILSAYAGYVIGTSPDIYLYIISKDQKYFSLNNFYPDGEFNISVQSDISGKAPEKKTEPEQVLKENKNPAENHLLTEVINNLKISKAAKEKIYQIIISARREYPEIKHQQYIYVYNRLKSTYPEEAYEKWYYAVRPYI